MKRPRSEWLNSTQAARRLGIRRRDLYRLIDEGRLPAYRFGHVVRLRIDDVEAYIRRSLGGDER